MQLHFHFKTYQTELNVLEIDVSHHYCFTKEEVFRLDVMDSYAMYFVLCTKKAIHFYGYSDTKSKRVSVERSKGSIVEASSVRSKENAYRRHLEDTMQ